MFCEIICQLIATGYPRESVKVKKIEKATKTRLPNHSQASCWSREQELPKDLMLQIPGYEQGGQMLHRPYKVLYFRSNLLEEGDMRKTILNIGLLEMLSIGRMEDQELTMGVARQTGGKGVGCKVSESPF